jgi:hypothetical protein
VTDVRRSAQDDDVSGDEIGGTGGEESDHAGDVGGVGNVEVADDPTPRRAACGVTPGHSAMRTRSLHDRLPLLHH